MIFNDGYYHPLDREYGEIWTPEQHTPEMIEPIEKPIQKGDPNRLTSQDVGSSTLMLHAGTEDVKARIRHGLSRIELGFPGKGKSSQQALTPESFGKEERQAIRDLARINELKVSTHASIAIAGLAGFTQQGFAESSRQESLDEIKRAIDFAADASTGGAVVVHTGEFPRSIAGYYGKEGVRKDGAKFKEYEKEEQEAVHFLVDNHTGKIIDGVREDQVAWIPKQQVANGEKVWLQAPDKDTNKMDAMKFEMIKTYKDEIKNKFGETSKQYEKANALFREDRVPVYETDPQGNIQTELIRFSEFKKRKEFQNTDGTPNTEKAALEFFKMQQQTQMHQALGSAREFEQHYNDGMRDRERLKDTFNNFTSKKEEAMKDQNKYGQLLFETAARIRGRPVTTPEDKKMVQQLAQQMDHDPEGPEGFMSDRLADNERRIAYGRETSSGGRLQARRIQDQIMHTENIEEYGMKKSAITLAQAGMFAMDKTRATNKQLKQQGHEKIDPIYVSPENIFQNTFGSHPQELKQIIIKSREEMENRLVEQKKMNRQEAKKLAKKHIAGTFDIGHANIWKKYYEGTDKDFNKWLIDQAKDLIKGGFVKHIHITDNLGYHDEHLAVGQGTAPIKELVKELEKEGIKDVIVEPGSTNFMTMWPDSLKGLGSPIYAIDAPYQRGFDQIQQSHAGYINPPYFVTNTIYPSDEWRIWSGVPLE
tara:strand:+ start:5394 stop:7511 length:2118 start_codon:yes stop_codon:yes gene_type:complete